MRTAALNAKLFPIDLDPTENVIEADAAIWAMIDPVFQPAVQVFRHLVVTGAALAGVAPEQE